MVAEPSPKFAPATRNDNIHHPTTSTSLEPLCTTSPNASNRLLQHRAPYDLPDHLWVALPSSASRSLTTPHDLRLQDLVLTSSAIASTSGMATTHRLPQGATPLDCSPSPGSLKTSLPSPFPSSMRFPPFAATAAAAAAASPTATTTPETSEVHSGQNEA